MKKIYYILTILLTLFIFKSSAFANKINSIDMNIYIDQYGNANVTEVWDTYLNEGTEGFRTFTNLDGSKITGFTVSDDSGLAYSNLYPWDVNKTFEYKAYKYGINNTGNGLELCWGISSYGDRRYTLNYTINDFVKHYTDVEGIYFNFLNLNQKVNDVKIAITSYVPFSLDNARIWAFGFDGSIRFSDGKIIIKSSGPVTSDEYVVGLVRFQEDLFETSIYMKKSFDDVYDSAMEGAKENKNSVTNAIKSMFYDFFQFLSAIKSVLIPAIIAVVLSIFLRRKKRFDMYHQNYKNMENINAISKSDNQNESYYYRDIPCNKSLPIAYWVCYQYGLVSDNELRKGIISAYFTKWIYEEKLKIITNNNAFDKYSMDISVLSTTHFDSEVESTLASFLIKADNGNNVISSKEFYKWSKENYHKFDYWYNRIFGIVKEELSNKGLLYKSTNDSDTQNLKNESYFNIKKVDVDSATDEVNNYAKQLKGLKNFMLDFGNVAEKEFFEVHTFVDYLMFACLLGIADKVEAQFKKLYPDYIAKYEFDYSMIGDLTGSIFRCYLTGHDAGIKQHASMSHNESLFGDSHDYSGTSTSSGGGGSSYSGGGHSAGGSSGGGFR